MVICPSCATRQTQASEFCSACGVALGPELAATVMHNASAPPSKSSVPPSSSVSSHHGRFLPGTKVADRYRIVSLVGKGGMGEVYRADDLKLGHTVALKFLPKELAGDPQRLEYFLSEVRLTRQISHPNVCRVYDIGEADGQHFLSMEYIDGEDLRVLLRRIGRLPEGKGIQIAQQLCAGLAAAHEKGVLHRDLKPANIMLDGRGQVRITDFGLAKLAGEAAEGEIAGTPAYMAPEQLTRGQTTIQSDLYSLGLILYEVFTGEAARKTSSLPELIRANEESSLSQTLQLPDGINPAVQRTISRCLEREPHERPISANAVAASLPGGDPLAAALAAGETPSPELVAAAGGSGLLSLRTATIYLAVTLIGLALVIHFNGAVSPSKTLKPGAVEIFAGKARELLKDLRHDVSEYEKYRFDLVKYKDEEERRLEFWYRSSPKHLFQEETTEHMFQWWRRVELTNPPLVVPRMTAVVLNGDQALRKLYVVPDATREGADRLANIKHEYMKADGQSEDEAKKAAETRFLQNLIAIAGPAFKAAKLPIPDGDEKDGSLSEPFPYSEVLSPKTRPPFAVDDYFVFEPKRDNDLPDVRHIELALAERKLVYFNVVRHPTVGEKERGNLIAWMVSLLILPVLMVLAWRNTSRGRSDRRTAWRVAVTIFFVTLLERRLNCGLTLEMFRYSLLFSAGMAFQYWVYYLALEPIVRKFWPGILTAWSRAMTGRWRDPSLGHSLLVGAMMGTLIPSLYFILVGDSKDFLQASAFSGNTELLALVLRLIRFFSGWGIYVTIILVLCRMVVRSNRLAAVLATALLMIFWMFDDVAAPNRYTIVLIAYFMTVMFFLIRFGVVAAFTFLFCHHLLMWIPFTVDLKGPDVAPTLFTVVVVLAIAGYGFYTSVGGRRFFANLFASQSSPSSAY